MGRFDFLKVKRWWLELLRKGLFYGLAFFLIYALMDGEFRLYPLFLGILIAVSIKFVDGIRKGNK